MIGLDGSQPGRAQPERATAVGRQAWRVLLATLAFWLALAACGRAAPLVTSQPQFPATTAPAARLTPATAATGSVPTIAGGKPSTNSVDPAAAMLPGQSLDTPALAGASRYAIDLKIDFPAHAYEGTLQLDTTNRENVALDELYFRLLPNSRSSYGDGLLAVDRVQVNGQAVRTELLQGDTVLRVSLPQKLNPGDKARVDMDFTGQVPKDFGGAGSQVGYGIYNFSNNVLALAGWYPMLSVYDRNGWNLDPVSDIGDSVYADDAFYAVNVTAPAGVTLAATGSAVDRQVQGEQATTHFQSGPVREFFLIGSPDFKVTSAEMDGIQVNSYSLPGYDQAGSTALDATRQAAAIYNQDFGKYPYRELDVVQAPMRYALGVEFPGIFLLASDLYDAPDSMDFKISAAHEAAHQWWYNLVGNDVFEEPWLDEGLATYSSSLYAENALGQAYRAGLLDYWQQRYDKLVSTGKDDQVTQSLGYFEGLNQSSVYGAVVYVKAALFFDALRQEIGDQAFFAALQAYYQAERYGIATAPDLLGAFEKASGRNLQEFYRKWLYEKGS